jgi:hypothetical protein
MLRLETATGYYLITHSDHAHLAGSFAEAWGNALFPAPTPRESVLHGIHVHDDGWLMRDASPVITRAGKPAAFSTELVGKYSAFEEIDLAEYLAVRESAVQQVEQTDPYAALLVSLHTYNLLTERADRSTIAPESLPLLDAFLSRQRIRQTRLHHAVRHDARYTAQDTTSENIFHNFRLLQACDNLSLLSAVAYDQPTSLQHSFVTAEGPANIHVTTLAARHFKLTPYPLREPEMHFQLPARHVAGHQFESSDALAESYQRAVVESLEVIVSAD